MGCEIHAYIDYDERVYDDKCVSEVRTHCLSRIHFVSNYRLFTIMAGVRGVSSVQGQTPVSKPKGLPKTISWRVESDAYLHVLDDDEASKNPGFCSRKNAEKWGGYVDDTKMKINHPEWHSHSWLTLEEVEEVIRRYSNLKDRNQIWLLHHEEVPEGYILDKEEWSGMRVAHHRDDEVAEIPVEILASRAMMKSVRETGRQCRLVFWFHN